MTVSRTIVTLFFACHLLQAQELERVLAGIRKHVARLENSVPDFICDERIESRLFSGAKQKRATRAESLLTTIHQAKGFSESRASMRINGKRTSRNEIRGPFVWHGGPAYGDLHFLFNSARGQTCMHRELHGLVYLNGRHALLMLTRASSDVEEDQNCRNVRPDAHDSIWIDPDTLNVIRIESYDPPTTVISGSKLTLIVDYAPVNFGGAGYWLPEHFVSRLDFPGTPKHLEYEAHYSNYHKFETTSTVHVDSIP